MLILRLALLEYERFLRFEKSWVWPLSGLRDFDSLLSALFLFSVRPRDELLLFDELLLLLLLLDIFFWFLEPSLLGDLDLLILFLSLEFLLPLCLLGADDLEFDLENEDREDLLLEREL